MAKCSDCRKNDALDSDWERFKRWLFYKLFPKQIVDLSQERFTQGFSDGYVRGFDHGSKR